MDIDNQIHEWVKEHQEHHLAKEFVSSMKLCSSYASIGHIDVVTGSILQSVIRKIRHEISNS